MADIRIGRFPVGTSGIVPSGQTPAQISSNLAWKNLSIFGSYTNLSPLICSAWSFKCAELMYRAYLAIGKLYDAFTLEKSEGRPNRVRESLPAENPSLAN